MTYAEKLKHPFWQKKRLYIFKRDKFKCTLCNDLKTTLHVHHKDYNNAKNPWESPNHSLVTLCAHCHSAVEYLKKENPEIIVTRGYKKINDDLSLFLACESPNEEHGFIVFIDFENEEIVKGYKIPHQVVDLMLHLLNKPVFNGKPIS